MTRLNEQLHWMRDTWYTPRRDTRYSTITTNMFSRVYRAYADKTFLTAMDAEDEATGSDEKEKVHKEGFTRTHNRWLNVYTTKETKHHPCVITKIMMIKINLHM